MNKVDLISWIQNWYSTKCDGEWEHGYGVEIYTIDNPGWRLKVDLKKTLFENKFFEPKKIERNEIDWIQYWVNNSVFEAAGGPGNLYEMINIFRRWVDEGII